MMKSLHNLSRLLFAGIIALMFTTACANGGDQAKAWNAIHSGALLLDVRTPEEFASGHLQGAINIPYDQISSRIEEVGSDKKRSIVVYCRSGKRSAAAMDTLNGLGYTGVINGGGYEAMKSAEQK